MDCLLLYAQRLAKSIFCFLLWIGVAHTLYGQTLTPKREKGRWGFVDAAGTLVTPYEYDEVKPLREGYYCVCQYNPPAKGFTDYNLQAGYYNKCGLLSPKGKLLSALTYSNIEPFSEGRARVEERYLYGYIDRNGKEVVPTEYEHAGDFRLGRANVERNEIWIYIDTNGVSVMPPKMWFWGATPYGPDSIARVSLDNEEYVYVDYKFRQTNPPKNRKQWPDNEESEPTNRIYFQKNEQKKWGAFNAEGKQVIPYELESIGRWGEDKIAVAQYRRLPEEKKARFLYCYYNENGEKTLAYRFSGAKAFNNGVAPAREVKPGKFWEELWGLINSNGEWTLPPKYDYIHDMEDGWAFAAKNLSNLGSKWAFFYINNRGEEIPFGR